jgi:hypothetical protein
MTLRLMRRLLPERLYERLEQIVTAFALGLRSLHSRGDLARLIATSILAWLCEAAMYLIIALGFGFAFPWPAALLTTAVANLFTLVPSSPGYVGIFETGILSVLVGVMGLPESPALSYALILHAALWAPITLLGLFFWSRESLGWRQLRDVRREQERASAPPRQLTSSRRG